MTGIFLLPETILLAGLALALAGSFFARTSWWERYALPFLQGAQVVSLLSWFLHQFGRVDFPGFEDNLLFVPARVAMGICGFGALRWIAFSRGIASYRRTEFAYLVILCQISATLLWMTNNYLIAVMLLWNLSVIGTALTGISFADYWESEGTLKYWLQGTLCLVSGLVCGLILLGLAKGLSYADLREYYSAGGRMATMLAMGSAIPFLVVAGIFPFYRGILDRDDTSPWITQAVNATMITGPCVLALAKFSSGVLMSDVATALSARGITFFAFIGMGIGGFLSYGQKRVKGFLASISFGIWSTVLFVSTVPGGQAAPAGIVAFCIAALALFVSIFLLAWITQEQREAMLQLLSRSLLREKLPAACLGVAMGALSFLPPFPGFIVLSSALVAALQRRSIFLFVGSAILTLVLGAATLRPLVSLHYKKRSEPGTYVLEGELSPLHRIDMLWLSFNALILGAGGLLGMWLIEKLQAVSSSFLNS